VPLVHVRVSDWQEDVQATDAALKATIDVPLAILVLNGVAQANAVEVAPPLIEIVA
jgi:hypothetical protein